MCCTDADKKRFADICANIGELRRRSGGIGTLSERTLHAAIKKYIEPDEEKHERRVCGAFADILDGNRIVEVQTRGFDRLRKKLDAFFCGYRVEIVYPIPYKKWIVWIDESTGETTKRRKSPRKGSFCDCFFELYKLKPYLTNEKLSVRLMLVELEEYRLKNGWSADGKRGSTRFERFPLALEDEIVLRTPEDYLRLLPKDLPEEFTVKDFSEKTGLTVRRAGTAVNVLFSIGQLDRTGKKGRAWTYKVK